MALLSITTGGILERMDRGDGCWQFDGRKYDPCVLGSNRERQLTIRMKESDTNDGTTVFASFTAANIPLSFVCPGMTTKGEMNRGVLES